MVELKYIKRVGSKKKIRLYFFQEKKKGLIAAVDGKEKDMNVRFLIILENVKLYYLFFGEI